MIPFKTASVWRDTAECRRCGIRESVKGVILDLELETVSRVVSRLMRQGWPQALDRLGRHDRVPDAAALAAVA